MSQSKVHPHHPTPDYLSIEEKSPQASSDYQVLLVKMLHPLLNVGYFCGFFPFHISNKSTITHHKTCHYFLIIGAVLGLLDCSFHIYSICNSILVEHRGILDIITQTVWVTSAIISISISLKTCFHHEGPNVFFENWKQLEPAIVHLIPESIARKRIRIYYAIYSTLAILSIVFCCFHSIRVPFFPTYILHFVNRNGASSSYPWWMILLNALHQAIRVTWIWVGTAMLECSCAIIAGFFNLALKGIVLELEKSYGRRKLNANGECVVDGNTTPMGEHNKCPDEENPKEKYNWLTCPLLISIRHYQILSELQALINGFVGFLLFVDLAQLIILICSLTFLPLKYVDNFDVDYMLIYCGNGICMILRLIVLVICLGDVYPAAQITNMEFGKVITTRYFPNQVLNPVLGHLSIYSASPICFSAWGFFAITKGTLLTSISLIVTYLIVFLQLNTN